MHDFLHSLLANINFYAPVCFETNPYLPSKVDQRQLYTISLARDHINIKGTKGASLKKVNTKMQQAVNLYLLIINFTPNKYI